MANKLHGNLKAGATSVSIPVQLISSSTFAEVTGKVFGDVTASYWRQGGARVAITPATLASISAAWSAGGFILADDTNMPGVYRFDVPDAAFATGADWVVVAVKVTGCLVSYTAFALETAGAAEVATLVGAPQGAGLPSLSA